MPCGASRETVKRSEFAGHAAYGYCASHSRYFWGFRLYLLCAADGMPIAFELAAANASERNGGLLSGTAGDAVVGAPVG